MPTLSALATYINTDVDDTSTAISDDGVWLDWNTQYLVTSASTNSVLLRATWSAWQSADETATTIQIYTSEAVTAGTWLVWNGDYVASANAYRTQAADHFRRHLPQTAGERVARQRAATLLEQHLTRAQRQELAQYGRFTVIARGSQRVYRVHRGRAGNVQLLDAQGRPVMGRTYCCHPAAAVPDEDTMLSQKLMIEHDEQEFLRLANVR